MNKKSIIALLILSIFLLIQNKGIAMNTNYNYVKTFKGIKEYKLSNGLKVLLKKDNSVPLVTFSVWYKVGSRNETDGIRGIAHFLEHMMFKGTKKYKNGEISETIQKLGGTFNAFTFVDGTAYHETVKPEYLEKMVELEADRMVNSRLDQEDIDSERSVVISELEGRKNSPTSILDEEIHKAAFKESPYHHPIIGYEDQIFDTTSESMKKFYKKYYTPSNSTVIVIGDIDEIKTLDLITKYFGKIKDSGKPEINIKKDKEQKAEKRIEVRREGNSKFVEIAYRIPSVKHKDIYALNIIEEILINGSKSRLQEALVEKGLATEVYGGCETYTDPSLFYVVAALTPKATHKKVEQVILKEIESLIKKAPSKKEIDSAKNRVKADFIYSLDGTYNQVTKIGYYEIIKTWEEGLQWPDKLSKVTKLDLNSALTKYFKKENRTVGYYIPILKKGEKLESSPVSIGGAQHYIQAPSKKTKVGKKQKIKKELASRSKNMFESETRTLKDGSKLIIYNKIDLPITYINGVIKGGWSLIKKTDEEHCTFIEEMLEKGSKNYSKDQIEDFQDSTGAEISFSCDKESFKFYSQCLNEHSLKTADLLLDSLTNPSFPSREIKKSKDLIIAELIEMKEEAGKNARINFSQLIFPEDHPSYMKPLNDEIKSVKKIKKDTLKGIHEKLVLNAPAIIVLTTNQSGKALEKLISKIEKKLLTSKKKESREVSIPLVKVNKNAQTVKKHIPGKHQSVVITGHITDITRNHPDFFKMIVANQIIGGDPLTSRLAKVIRDENGLVYTVFSFLNSTYGQGEFIAYFGTNKEKVDKTIKLLKQQLNKVVKEGVTPEELEKAKNSLIDSFISKNLATKEKVTSTLISIDFYNLGDDYIGKYPEIISGITLEDVNKAIKTHIKPSKLNISIAGDYK